MKKMIIAALAAAPIALAPPAHADAATFVDYLDRNGVNTSTRALAADAVDLGDAICNLYSAAIDMGRNPNHEVMAQLESDGNTDPAVWVVGAVTYLCPQYGYLLP